MRISGLLLVLFLAPAGHAEWKAFQYQEYTAASADDVSGSQWLNIGYFYEECKFPVLQIIDTLTNPNEISRGVKIPISLKVDQNKAWDWSATVQKSQVNDNVYVSIKAPITADFIGELIKGEILQVRTGRQTMITWSLSGATIALSQAFQKCIQTANDQEPEDGFRSTPEEKGYF